MSAIDPGIDSTARASHVERPIIEYTDAEVRFGALHAMGPVTLNVRPGEFLAIVGPSGCGKSTLLNLAAGSLAPASGYVRFQGRNISGPNSNVGYITQKNYCLPWRTVAGNVKLPLEYRRYSRARIKERTADVLKQVGLSGFENQAHQENEWVNLMGNAA
ncbi:MAG: ATP-binding cassette domain-containing protein [Alphaproteobacteria bacterium]|nr:ATP-binding cassette domain-containing protein [Alphaproteobacteria bacterium]